MNEIIALVRYILSVPRCGKMGSKGARGVRLQKGELLFGARRLKKTKFASGGALVELVAVVLCLTIVGAIIGIPLFVIGSSMSRYYVCSNCGNHLANTATMCPTCRALFTK